MLLHGRTVRNPRTAFGTVAAMAGRDVARGVRQLAHPLSNAYLVDGGDGLVLIDTGFRGRAVELRREVDRAARATGRDLAAIAVTHAHADHIGSLGRFAADSRVPVLAGAADAALIRSGGIPPSPNPTGLIGRLMGVAAVRVDVEPSRVDLVAGDGDTVPGAPALRVITTPGHTPGHVSYLLDDDGGVLFAGDIAVHVLGLRESFVLADRAAARRSLQRVAALTFEVAVFGHGPPITRGAAGRLRQLADRLAR